MKKEIKFESMVCQITKALMTDPVEASDGQIYERKAIQDVINIGGLSPFNGQPLTPELKPDTELQEAILRLIGVLLVVVAQKNPQMPEELQKLTNKSQGVIARYNSLGTLPNDILQIIGGYAGVTEKKHLAESGSKALLRFFSQAIKPANAEFTAFLHPILRLNPNQVKASLEARPDLVPPGEAELTKLLIHVVKGEITEAEAMLTANPALLLAKGHVIDFSGRTFFGKGITAFQYALAAQDMPMTQMLLKHSLKSEEAKRAVAEQYKELGEMLADKDENKHRALKNLNYSIDDLHKKLGVYIEKYDKMTQDEFDYEESERDWCKVVGGAQRKLPAWVILMMCERWYDNNRVVAWVLKNINVPVKRKSEHLYRWFDIEYVGVFFSSMAAARGREREECRLAVPSSYMHDHQVLALCQSARPGELPTLDSLYSSDDLASIGFSSNGFGQVRK